MTERRRSRRSRPRISRSAASATSNRPATCLNSSAQPASAPVAKRRARPPARPQIDEHRQRRRQHREELGVGRQQLGLVGRGEDGVEDRRQPAGASRRALVGAAPAGQIRGDGAGGQRRTEGGQGREGVHRPHVVAAEQPEHGRVEIEDRRELVLHAVAVGEPAGHHPTGDRGVGAFVDVHDRVDEAGRAQEDGHRRHGQQTGQLARRPVAPGALAAIRRAASREVPFGDATRKN